MFLLFLQVVISVEHFIVFLGHVVFLLLTRPNAHNKNFPYHVRTTQIGIMEAIASNPHAPNTNGNLGNNTLDAFSHGGNNYSVEAHNTAMDIFTVDTMGGVRSRHNGGGAAAVARPHPQPGMALSAISGARTRAPPPAYEAAVRRGSGGSGSDAGGSARGPGTANGGLATTIYDPNALGGDSDDEGVKK